jgi:hypothetical protein
MIEAPIKKRNGSLLIDFETTGTPSGNIEVAAEQLHIYET